MGFHRMAKKNALNSARSWFNCTPIPMDWGLQRLDAKLGGKDLVKAAHGEKKTAVGEPGRQGWRWWDDVISQSGMMAWQRLACFIGTLKLVN